MIKKLEKSDAKIITQIIQQSFHTVAIDFNITKYNCPSHPSFIKIGQVERFFEQNLKLFGYFTQNQLVGLVMLEKTKDDTTTWYIEKLSVLPAYRHHGIGKKLLEYTYSYIQENGGSYISIALINEQDQLKDWYSKLGFKQFMVKSFPQLPFTVAFMDKQLFALTKTSGKDAEIKQLIQSLDADLKIRYGEATIHGVDLEEADASGMHFFIGHYGKTAICCGAIRPFSKIQVEVKRMYVRPEYRGNGYAKKLYLKLEQTAFDLGYREILLETGKKQFEAHALYRKIGFQPIEKFGEYVNDPNSLCFSKLIDDY